MRPFEFRVWHKPTMQMHYVHSIIFAQGIVFTLPFSGSLQISQVLKLDDCDLMQFTGVLDENGVKIWEGDVVGYSWEEKDDDGVLQNYEDHIEIKYSRGSFFMQDEPLSASIGTLANKFFNMPVIGNKWEQSFLLENLTVTV